MLKHSYFLCNLLDLLFRYLFFSDWGTPARIGRANMDGSNVVILVQGQNLEWPNGLSLDYNENRLYWVDAKLGHVESMKFDGSDRRVIVRLTSHSFGLAVDKDSIYWTDWLSKSIHRAFKNDTAKATVLRRNHGGLMGIQIFDKTSQRGKVLI